MINNFEFTGKAEKNKNKNIFFEFVQQIFFDKI